MFQKLITYSIHNKLVVGVATLALIVWGVWSLIHLPFDATPDITNNQVQVITQAPSLGAQEVEQNITTPVEWLSPISRASRSAEVSREADSPSSHLYSTTLPTSIGHARRWRKYWRR